ncbi:MAG: AI-2E family transporter, partial [Xenococcaceae cyanobacterium MO_167.B52]|nr:AI-2E family transporter [Xenococcaceae cyanobacterium MO_167.B52]
MNFGTWIGIVAFSISLYVLWQIKQLLLLIFTAIVIATSLNTLVQRLCHRGLKRAYAVLLSMISLVGVLTGFFLIIVPPFIAQFRELALLFPQGIEILRKLIDLLLSRLDPELISYLPDIDQF